MGEIGIKYDQGALYKIINKNIILRKIIKKIIEYRVETFTFNISFLNIDLFIYFMHTSALSACTCPHYLDLLIDVVRHHVVAACVTGN